MKHERLNEYLYHYLEKDKTKSAIMLTGAWGSGKSHYIEYSLRPYLENKHKKCIVVSLYGITDLKDISKAIYMELRYIRYKDRSKKYKVIISMKNKIILKMDEIRFLQKISKLLKNRELKKKAKILGKTILNVIVQERALPNFNIKDKDLKELYESIDLTEKLIIFEDIERSSININEFLGFVNNFVEQDNVKVLLVANEDEILGKVTTVDFRTEKEKESESLLVSIRNKVKKNEEIISEKFELSDEAKKYLKTKEKTVNKTIKYESDYMNAVKNIIDSFESDKLNKYLFDAENIGEIAKIVELGNGNLRTFIFACQNIVDILEGINTSDNEIVKCIILSIMYFSYRYKENNEIKWDGNSEFSLDLGRKDYPLFKFCYEYIISNNQVMPKISEIELHYKNFKQYHSNEYSNTSINILYNYHISNEPELKKAMEEITKDLDNNVISFYSYGKLAKYLVKVGKVIEYDTSNIENLIVDNLKNLESGTYIEEHSLFRLDNVDKEEPLSEYLELKNRMIDVINSKKYLTWNDFTYEPDKINLFNNNIFEKNSEIYLRETLSKDLDLVKFIDMLSICTSEQIDGVRGIFWDIYRQNNGILYTPQNDEFLNSLYKEIEQLKNNDLDRIIKLQLQYLLDNITEFISK